MFPPIPARCHDRGVTTTGHRSANAYASKTNEKIQFKEGVTFNACSGGRHRHLQEDNEDNNERAQFPDEADPKASVVAWSGYPELFAEKPLHMGVLPRWNGSGMSLEDQKWANAQARDVNTALQQMATRNGVEFVDPDKHFHGDGYDHRIGSADPWLNGPKAPPEAFQCTFSAVSYEANPDPAFLDALVAAQKKK